MRSLMHKSVRRPLLRVALPHNTAAPSTASGSVICRRLNFANTHREFGQCAARAFCAAREVSSRDHEEVPPPTTEQLRRVFLQSAVPFVAFGIVDQSVLIYMGDFIDNSVGVMFALPTLAAAAMGQVFSDCAGVTFGGTIEAAAMKLGLPLPGLTQEQHKLGIVRRTSTAGGMIGVVTGCLIGMLNLLIIDMESADRAKRAKELQSIMKTVMEDGRDVVHCERATLWAVDAKANEMWSSVADGVVGILRIPLDGDSIAALVAKSGQTLNIPDVTKDTRCHTSNQRVEGFVTRNMLVAPVLVEGECMAVIQLLNKLDEDGKHSVFSVEDEKMVKMLAKHTSIFIAHANLG